MNVREIPIDELTAHPDNSNVMPPAMFEKLVGHLQRTGRYPPVIVRPGAGGYQILDGHHRVAALRRLGHERVRCVVWEVDDAEALVLLATLNRLQGGDDPVRRGTLLTAVCDRLGRAQAGRLLPDASSRIDQLMQLHAQSRPRLARRPGEAAGLPVPVIFFLSPSQREALEARLRAVGGTREEALMKCIVG